MIHFSGNTLKIAQVRKEDRGTYYCVSENGVGRGARQNINLEIEFAPVITAPRPRLGQALQYDMDLECHVEAYPPPGITWHKDELQLSNNQHYSISHFATADEYTVTTLRVKSRSRRSNLASTCARLLISLALLKLELNFLVSHRSREPARMCVKIRFCPLCVFFKLISLLFLCRNHYSCMSTRLRSSILRSQYSSIMR